MSVYTRKTNHIQKNLTRTEEQALNELIKDSSSSNLQTRGVLWSFLHYEKYKEEIQKQLTLPSYVKDSIDFINKISPITGLTEDCILVTLDVESLYTSIPPMWGLAALGH
ncbi:unnamed protein product [Coregonus sp. 'balchen']|nr:unnamed protein product [Coregonus sp. 'balchen']